MNLIVESHGAYLQRYRWDQGRWGERVSAERFDSLLGANNAGVGAGCADFMVHCVGCGSVVVRIDDCCCEDHGVSQ